VSDQLVPSKQEIETILRGRVLLHPEHEDAGRDQYPRLWSLSAGKIFWKNLISPDAEAPPEYVKVPMRSGQRAADRHFTLVLALWNMLWDKPLARRRLFGKMKLPTPLQEVADRGDFNVMFIPRTKSRYHEYMPLFHLLPRVIVERYGLPLLPGGQWPPLAQIQVDTYLPIDFETRLSRAWAATVWRHLMPGSPMSGFTTSEPIRLLAHNLDFWIPSATEVIQNVARGQLEQDDWPPACASPSMHGSGLERLPYSSPGLQVWAGEEQAAEIVDRTVEGADADGRLRGILDAVRSNRVEDDFSERWTYAREDFERKLYRKRSKIKVRFVELTDTIPVQGPETEVVDRMVFGDFLALLNDRDREVVVLLYSGVTNLTEIANIMGYSNHSTISKRLTRIRKQAARFFDAR
jgi:hypothetical protein